jgi:hypothetical protein
MGEGRLLCKEAKNGEKWGHVKYLLRPVEKWSLFLCKQSFMYVAVCGYFASSTYYSHQEHRLSAWGSNPTTFIKEPRKSHDTV